MPFKALLNGRLVISINLSDEEWDELKRQTRSGKIELILPCCNSPGYLRKSKYGTKHFVHKRGFKCDKWTHESFEHMRLKEIVYRVCIEEGWNADVEHVLPSGEIADVYAEKDSKKVVFEIQLSHQNLERFRERQEKYLKDGVRAFWLFKPTKSKSEEILSFSNEKLPIFAIQEGNDEKEFCVKINDVCMPIKTFVKYVLRNKLQFRVKTLKKEKIPVKVFKTSTTCWKCGRKINVVFIDPQRDQELDLPPYKVWQIIAKLQKRGAPFFSDVGPIKYLYSRTMRMKYWMNTCKYCGAKIGGFFLNYEIVLEALYDENLPYVIVELTLQKPIEHIDKRWIIK